MCLPGIDGVCDYDSPYAKYLVEEQYVPDIDANYIVYWQGNGVVYVNVFTVFDGDNGHEVFSKALEFAQKHDTLLFYQELGLEFLSPKTGEPVETPIDSPYTKHYYDQPVMPYENTKHGFKMVETDELPF